MWLSQKYFIHPSSLNILAKIFFDTPIIVTSPTKRCDNMHVVVVWNSLWLSLYVLENEKRTFQKKLLNSKDIFCNWLRWSGKMKIANKTKHTIICWHKYTVWYICMVWYRIVSDCCLVFLKRIERWQWLWLFRWQFCIQ